MNITTKDLEIEAGMSSTLLAIASAEDISMFRWIAWNLNFSGSLMQYRDLIVRQGSAEQLESFDNNIYKKFLEKQIELENNPPCAVTEGSAFIGFINVLIVFVPWIYGAFKLIVDIWTL
jgi:hypothetical protein